MLHCATKCVIDKKKKSHNWRSLMILLVLEGMHFKNHTQTKNLFACNKTTLVRVKISMNLQNIANTYIVRRLLNIKNIIRSLFTNYYFFGTVCFIVKWESVVFKKQILIFWDFDDSTRFRKSKIQKITFYISRKRNGNKRFTISNQWYF